MTVLKNTVRSVVSSALTNTVRQGSKLNSFKFLKEAWNTNDISSISNIFYATTGDDYNINLFVPTKSKIAYYPFVTDSGGFIKFNEAKIVSLTPIFSIIDHSNYDSITGAWVTSTPPYYYTIEIGSTMTFSFTGNKLEFRTLVDNRGGAWSFSIDGGTTIIVSVWNDSMTEKVFLISDSLSYESHTVIATFIGQDIEHPTVTPRGWIYYGSTKNTFIVSRLDSLFTTELNITPNSNTEFALSVKKSDGAYISQWVPTHEYITTSPISRNIYVDNVELNDFSLMTDVLPCQQIKIIASYYCFNTNELVNIMRISCIYTIDKYGYNVKYTIKALTDILVSQYTYMLPVHRDFASSLEIDDTSVYDLADADGIADIIPNSIAFRITGGLYQIASAIKNINAIGSVMFIENRVSDTIQKIYCQKWDTQYLLRSGEEIDFENHYYIGEI